MSSLKKRTFIIGITDTNKNKTQNLKERPAIVNFLKKYRGDIDNIVENAIKTNTIDTLSIKLANFTRDTIFKDISLRIPNNKPSTIKRKGKNNPLIETKAMINSIQGSEL